MLRFCQKFLIIHNIFTFSFAELQFYVQIYKLMTTKEVNGGVCTEVPFFFSHVQMYEYHMKDYEELTLDKVFFLVWQSY